MNKTSLGAKLAISFSIVLILMVAICVLTLRNMKVMKQDNSWVVHTQEVLRVINLVKSDMQDAETGQRGFLLTGNDIYLEPYHASLINLPINLGNLKELTADNPVQQQYCNRIEGLIGEKTDELEETINTKKSGDHQAAMDILFSNRGKILMDNIRTVLDDMVNEEALLYEQRVAEQSATEIKAKVPIYVAMILGLLVNILLTVFLTRSISAPIKRMSVFADQIAKGDLTNEIELNRGDEIGSLANSFRRMQKTMINKSEQAEAISLGNLTMDIEPISAKDMMGISFQTMVTNLRTQLKEINEAVNVLASSSSEIMAAVSQLAATSSETATSVGETTITVEEVKQTAEVSSHKAKEVSDKSDNLSDISKEGLAAIANTIDGMNRIKRQMSSIANMVVKLSEQSQTIGEITATVNEIAEQSNLLAVNAAIEAAKAGEQGKGFTVVAQEIKMLSDRSKEATSKVRNILRDVQKSISSAVMATEEGAKAVDEGLLLTDKSGGTIKILAESITDAANAAMLISASSQQQLDGMDQVVAAMENIKESSSQSAVSTQQTVDSVKELQMIGEKLNEMMKQYTLQ